MKLITLNIWGGHIQEPLLQFIKTYCDVDIFCLQEVYHEAQEKISTEDRSVSLDIFAKIQSILPEHQGFFRPVVDEIYGIAMFVKKVIPVLGEGEICIHENPDYPGRGPTHSRNLQWIECQIQNQIYAILNIHGLWNGLGKTDTPARIAQSHKIKNFMETIHIPKIVCGDFNIRPETESMKILEQGLRNLISEYCIYSTRTHLYPKQEKFADYVLASPEIKVKAFGVLKEVVSDHVPLLLEFET